jgi:hypothetical protein
MWNSVNNNIPKSQECRKFAEEIGDFSVILCEITQGVALYSVSYRRNPERNPMLTEIDDCDALLFTCPMGIFPLLEAAVITLKPSIQNSG